MSYKWSTVICILIYSLGVLECKQLGTVETLIKTGTNVANLTRIGLKETVNTIIKAPFKTPEVLGIQLENSIVGLTSVFGKTVKAIAAKIGQVSQKFQQKEKKFIRCVQSEQFDPVKAIVLDVVKCVTKKADTVHSIVHNIFVEVNITYTIVKSFTQLPKCEDSKCLADYTSGLVGKSANILVGLVSIVQGVTVGLAATPFTLPICFATNSAVSPAKVFGKLTFDVLTCLKA